ncbi:hypothetical protein HK104_011474 [Borealophlyctis nickersoniae]|nr:hypothetical protein HK104_011474 [Borealophlyctis nickersoniae]
MAEILDTEKSRPQASLTTFSTSITTSNTTPPHTSPPHSQSSDTIAENNDSYFHAPEVQDQSEPAAPQKAVAVDQEQAVFLNSLLWSLDAAVIACNMEGTVTFMNRAAQQLCCGGRNPVNMPMNMPLAELASMFADPDPTPLVSLSVEDFPLARALRGDVVEEHDFILLGPGAPQRRISIRGGPLSDPTGVVIGASIVLHDVTGKYHEEERRKVQQAEESEMQFRELAEALPQIIYVSAPDGTCLYGNSAWERYTGLPRDEWIQPSNWERICHPEDTKASTDSWQESLRTGTMFQHDVRVKNRDGAWRWHLSRSIPVIDHNTGRVEKWFGTMTDIHEQKNNYYLAHALREQLQKFISSAMVIVWAVDANGVITFSDGLGLLTLGIKPGQLVGQVVWDVYGDNDPIITGIRRALEKGETSSLEAKTEIAGSDVWFVSSFSPLRDDTGAVTGCVGIGTDITEMKQVQQALAESEKRGKRLVASSPIGVMIFNHTGECLEVNEAYMKMMGLARNQAHSMTDKSTESTSLLQRVDDRIVNEALSSTGQDKKTFEYNLRRSDGLVIPALIGISPLDDVGGQFVAFVVDLTEQMKFRRKAEEAEQRLRDVVSNVPGVFIWCISPSGILTVCEGKGLEGLEIKPEEVLDKHYSTLFKNARNLDEYIARAFRAETFTEIIEVGPRSFEMHFSHICSIGQATRVVGIATDITDRLIAEKALEKSLAERNALLARESAAQEASKLKSEFLATMSHEIRTPISGVIGMTELLLESQLDPTQTEYASNIRLSAECLLTVINDILDFSKVEAGKLEIDPAPFDVKNLVVDIVKLLALSADKKEIRLKTRVELRSSGKVIGGAARIRQILINLVSNAIKFTASKGSILVHLTDSPPEGTGVPIWQYVFAISDTGIGLSRNALQRLFQPFSQAESSTARRFGGTGLGLSISKGLVELMGGNIAVESTEGVGSTFVVTLPLPQSTEEVPSPSRPHTPLKQAHSFTDFHVLVAEDNHINQVIAAKMLQKLSVKYTIVEDGHAVIRAMTSGTNYYDLILMDCQMPGMDGYEATRILRASPDSRLRTVPIIAMSANVLESDKARCIECGMSDHLGKPVKQKDLDAMLGKWLYPEI